MLATLFFFAYLLIVPAAIIGLGIWLFRYMTRLQYTSEKRILFTVIITVCLTFIAFSLGSRLYAWQKPESETPPAPVQQQPATSQSTNRMSEQPVPALTQQTNSSVEYPTADAPLITQAMSEEDRLRLYEAENYPELYEQRLALGQEIKALENFFVQINALAEQTPKQIALLRDIARLRKNGYDRLQTLNLRTSQQLRDFWVHYNTGNSGDAIKKFEPVAKSLTRKIKETRGQLNNDKSKEAEVIAVHMRRAGTSLKSNTIPAQLAGKITAYGRNNRLLVTDWLREQDAVITLDALQRLAEQRTLINDRIQRVNSFRQSYKDLNQTLTRTLGLWEKAKESNYFAEYRLLYAAEARLVVDRLNLASVTADKRLNKELNAYTEFVAGHADDALTRAEKAYKPQLIR